MSDFQPKPNTGNLFARQKKGPNSPDVGGDFTLDAEVLAYVSDCIANGRLVKLELSGWAKMGKNNTRFTSLSVSIPWEIRRNQQGGQGNRAAPQQAYGQQQRPPQATSYPQRTGPVTRQVSPGGQPFYAGSLEDEDFIP